MHFNLNHSLKQHELSNADYEIIETKIPINFELIKDCSFQSSMNENEMNFQYHENLEVEFLDSNVKLKKVVLSVEENNTEKSSSYEEEDAEVNKSLEGLILKELLGHLKYASCNQENENPSSLQQD